MTAQCPGSAVNIRLVPVVAGARGVSHRRHGAAIPILKSATEGAKSTRKREEKFHASIGYKQSFMSDPPMMAPPALLACAGPHGPDDRFTAPHTGAQSHQMKLILYCRAPQLCSLRVWRTFSYLNSCRAPSRAERCPAEKC